jgi:hypothetical protein
MMLFRRGMIKKSTHRTPLISLPQVPDQGSTVDFFGTGAGTCGFDRGLQVLTEELTKKKYP